MTHDDGDITYYYYIIMVPWIHKTKSCHHVIVSQSALGFIVLGFNNNL
jgi:hypothetical protein